MKLSKKYGGAERNLTSLPPIWGTKRVGINTIEPRERTKCWNPNNIASTNWNKRNQEINEFCSDTRKSRKWSIWKGRNDDQENGDWHKGGGLLMQYWTPGSCSSAGCDGGGGGGGGGAFVVLLFVILICCKKEVEKWRLVVEKIRMFFGFVFFFFISRIWIDRIFQRYVTYQNVKLVWILINLLGSKPETVTWITSSFAFKKKKKVYESYMH